MTFCSPTMGGIVAFAEMEGHLVIVRALEFEADVPTENGLSDAIYADLCDLHGVNPDGTNGLVSRYGVIFGKVMVPALRRQIGDLVLGRVEKGISKSGRTPPWRLADATGDPQAVHYAQQWLDAHPEFEQSKAVPYAPGTTRPVPTPADRLGTPPPVAAPLPVPAPTLPPVPNTTQPVPFVTPGPTLDLASLSPETINTLKALGVKIP